MITVTPKALEKIKSILAEESSGDKVRAYVEGGGCAGFTYKFAIESIINDDDFIVESTDNLVIVDSISMQYLDGATLDYQESLTGSNFIMTNPNTKNTCGCGSSFSV